MILEACKRGNKSFLQKILDDNKTAGIKPNLNVKDGLGNTPLHYSAQGQHLGNFFYFILFYTILQPVNNTFTNRYPFDSFTK